MSFKVNEDEALILEEIELREARRRRTEKALRGIPEKKERKYKQVHANIAAGRFNDGQKRDKVLAKIYKRNAKSNSIADAMVKGDDPL